MKDEAEKPSESAEKGEKTEAADKVKKEGTESSEREEGDSEGGEAKASPAGNISCFSLITTRKFHLVVYVLVYQ